MSQLPNTTQNNNINELIYPVIHSDVDSIICLKILKETVKITSGYCPRPEVLSIRTAH
jgi:hypothetical protein